MVKFKYYNDGPVYNAALDYCRCDFCGGLLDVGLGPEIRDHPVNPDVLQKVPYYTVSLTTPDEEYRDKQIGRVHHTCAKHLDDVLAVCKAQIDRSPGEILSVHIRNWTGNVPKDDISVIPNLKLDPNFQVKALDKDKPFWLEEEPQ